MIDLLIAEFQSMAARLKSGCGHSMEVSIDESGDGQVIEWECLCCGRVRVEFR